MARHSGQVECAESEGFRSQRILLTLGGSARSANEALFDQGSKRSRSNGYWLEQVPFRDGYGEVTRKVEGHLLKPALEVVNGNRGQRSSW